MDYQSKLKFLVNLLFGVTVALIIYICAKFLLGYLFPFVIASVIAYSVQKPASFISSKIRLKANICAALLSALLFFVSALIIIFAVYKAAFSVGDILTRLPKILKIISNIFEELSFRFNSVFNGMSPQLSSTLNKIGDNILESLGSGLTSLFSGVAAGTAKGAPGFLLSCIVALVASCYIAKDYTILAKFLRELCGERIYFKITEIKKIFTQSILKLLKGYLLLMLITMLELAVGFLILGIRNPVLLAILVSVIDLLPVLGTGTVLIPWGLISCFLGDNKGFLILALYLLITLVRNFLEPKIIGDKIGINPLFTLIIMFAGLKLIGFWGLLLFPICFIVIFKYYKNQLELDRISIK